MRANGPCPVCGRTPSIGHMLTYKKATTPGRLARLFGAVPQPAMVVMTCIYCHYEEEAEYHARNRSA